MNRGPRTGLRAIKSRLFLRGLAAVDRRTATGRVYITTRAALLEHLGGPDVVTEPQLQLVEMLTRGLLYLGHLDAILLERTSITNAKRTKVVPLVAERMRMAEGLTRQLQALGLERRTRTLDLAQALTHARAGPPEHEDGRGSPPSPGSHREPQPPAAIAEPEASPAPTPTSAGASSDGGAADG